MTYYLQPKHRLLNHVIRSFAADSINQCSRECLSSDQECMSVNYFPPDGVTGYTCDLNRSTHKLNPADFMIQDNSLYGSPDVSV